MKKLIVFCIVFASSFAALAQVNTNIVILMGAGASAYNTSWTYDTATGDYTNNTASGLELLPVSGHAGMWNSGNYFSTNFPTNWYYDYQGDANAAPAPDGAFYTTNPPPSVWTAGLTNFWTVPGDTVAFQASGRNMATTNNMDGLEVLLDGNTVFESTLSAGNGSLFSLDGRLQWDGTNINVFAEMNSGDPSNPQTPVFGQLTNYVVGTNSFQIIPIGNTNGFILTSAGVTTTRAPQSSPAPATSTQFAPGSISVGAGTYVAGIMPTNAFLGSQETTLWTTNALAFTGSNYIGEFPQLYQWSLATPLLGGSGMLPGTNEFEQLNGSFNGTNWFAITNGFVTWTNIYVSVTGGNVGVGGLTLWGVDHPEILGKINAFFGQEVEFGNPVNPNDAATKAYVDSTVHVLAPPIQMTGGWILDSETTTNGEAVSFYNHNTLIFWLNSMLGYIPIQTFSLSGTNGIMTIAQSNTLNGYFLESCTNLAPPIFWQNFTNFNSSTNGGEVTITLPLYTGTQCQFFRARTPTTVSANYSVPIQSTGQIWPSNVWSLAKITNSVPNFGYGTFNSNGQALVTVQVSNGVVRVVQTVY